MPEPSEVYDVFLSHGSPDKLWVETLARELEGLGLKVFLDVHVIEPAASFPLVLSDALAASRFLVLVLSPNSARPWVNLEWPSFLAHHGPQERLLPVMLGSTKVPALLAGIHRIDATDRDAGGTGDHTDRRPARRVEGRGRPPARHRPGSDVRPGDGGRGSPHHRSRGGHLLDIYSAGTGVLQ